MAEWHEQLSDDYRGNETLANIPDIDTLAKSYLDAQSYVGGAIRIPGEDAGEEDWNAFNSKLQEKVPTLLNLPSDEEEAKAALYARLGRPKDAQSYSVEADPELLNWAYENGLSDAQVRAWVETNSARKAAQDEQSDADLEQAMQELQKEWGYAYDQNLAAAKNAVLAFADEETQQFLVDSGMDQHPGMIRLMAKIGATLTESETKGLGGGNQFGLTPEQALTQIGEIQRNTEHPYNNIRSPGHREAVAKMEQLFNQAYPEAS